VSIDSEIRAAYQAACALPKNPTDQQLRDAYARVEAAQAAHRSFIEAKRRVARIASVTAAPVLPERRRTIPKARLMATPAGLPI
jgi:hypothetical protein